MGVLNFLLAECTDNAVAAHGEGAVPIMMQLLESNQVGTQAAASTCLRNIFTAREAFRQEFVELGGIEKMVGQLLAEKDPTLNNEDVQMEAMMNFQDLLEDAQGEFITEYVTKAVQLGALEKLAKLKENTEEIEVAKEADELIAKLSNVPAPRAQ